MGSFLKNTNTVAIFLSRDRGKYQIEISAPVLREVIKKFIPYLKIKDFRQAGKVKFSAQSLIFTLVLACICGHRSSLAIGKFWFNNQTLLKKSIPRMPDESVSHDTIKRTLESLVFDQLELFASSFSLHLLFETLSDLHMNSDMPSELIPFYKEVLYEYNLMQKERSLSVNAGGSPFKPPYKVYLFASTFRLDKLPEDLAQIYNNRCNVIETVRKYRNVGCCGKASFVTKPYHNPNVIYDPVDDDNRYNIDVDHTSTHNRSFKATAGLKAMAEK